MFKDISLYENKQIEIAEIETGFILKYKTEINTEEGQKETYRYRCYCLDKQGILDLLYDILDYFDIIEKFEIKIKVK